MASKIRYDQISSTDKTGTGTKLVTASGSLTQDVPLLYDASGNAIVSTRRGNTTTYQCADSSTLPTSGNLASFDSSGNLRDSGISPSGGPGGGLGLFSGLITVPTISSSGLTTGWNQAAGFSATNNATGITLTDSATHTGSYLEGIVKTYPATTFTLTTLFSLPYTGQNFEAIGLCILDTLTGKALTFSAIWPASGNLWNFIVDGWNSPTSHNTTPLGRTNAVYSFMWIRLVDNGTTISFQASSDATWWYQVYGISKASSFLGSSGFHYLGAFIETGDTAGGFTIGTTLMSWSGA